MSTLNLFVLGLLLLTSNLSLCALFAPSGSGSGSAGRLLQLWKLLFLAMIEVGAWAVVLHQGGAAPSLLETFSRCAACFALAGGEGGGLAPPWDEMKSFIALNGLLFIPVTLIPWMVAPPPREGAADELGEPFKIPDDPYPAAPHPPHSPSAPGFVRVSNSMAGTPPPQNSGAAEDGGPDGLLAPAVETLPLAPPPLISPHLPAADDPVGPPTPDQKPFGFRPTIPKVHSKKDVDSPEAALAEQMKPVGPTPPPIRFR